MLYPVWCRRGGSSWRRSRRVAARRVVLAPPTESSRAAARVPPYTTWATAGMHRRRLGTLGCRVMDDGFEGFLSSVGIFVAADHGRNALWVGPFWWRDIERVCCMGKSRALNRMVASKLSRNVANNVIFTFK